MPAAMKLQRCLLLGRKVMTNPDNILKSRNIILPTIVHVVKAIVFPVLMYGCESWTIEKAAAAAAVAAAAKSLQSCPTLGDPRDGSPPGSPVPGILQAKTLECQSLSRVRVFATPWIAARQASLSITNSWILLKLVCRVRDAIQPSHPLLSPSPPSFNLSQHQGLFQ